MPILLDSLLSELNQKCLAVENILLGREFDPPLDKYALRVYRQVETTRREVDLLLRDPALGNDQLLAVQFQSYQRLMRQFLTIEAYSLPVVLRFNDDDRYMTALCTMLMTQARVSLPPPLVATFSTEYYWLHSPSNLICTSALECDSLLGLPDLYHEVGHLLIFEKYGEFTATFLQELRDYVEQEKRRILMEQRGREAAAYDGLFVQWDEYWVIEFTADMIATYLVGEAYGWQHLRLCSRTGEPIYSPSLGEESSHPANDARLRGIIAMLKNIGLSGSAQTVEQSWEKYVQGLGDAPMSPGDYRSCYPDALIVSLANQTFHVCEDLGLCKATESSATNPVRLTTLINEGWTLFLSDATAYAQWEKQRIQELRSIIAPSIPL